MNEIISQNCLIFCRFSICSKNVQLVLPVLNVVNEPCSSCLYKSRWLKGMSAVNQPNFWGCLAVAVDSEKTPVFCAIKVYKESVGNHWKKKEKRLNFINILKYISCFRIMGFHLQGRNNISVSRLEKFQATWLPDPLLLDLHWYLKPFSLVCETSNLQGKQFSCCPPKSRFLYHWARLEAHLCIQALKFSQNVELFIELVTLFTI